MAEKKTYPKEIFIQKCKESESLLKHLIGPEHSIEEPLKITLLKKKPVPPETFRKLIKTCRKLVKVLICQKSALPEMWILVTSLITSSFSIGITERKVKLSR